MVKKKLAVTRNGYTSIGFWGMIDWWNSRIEARKRREEIKAARERELAAARERIRRENQTAQAFDRKMTEARKRQHG